MRKKSNIHPFLKMAGVKSEKEFYKKFPSDEEFFAAYPQARYGMRIADDGIGMLPIATGANPPAQGTMSTVPVPPMGKYVIPKDGEEDDDEKETPDQETPEQQQAKKLRKEHKYKLSKRASWNPFKKDNAWNTGEGNNTTDFFGTATALASSVLPYQPARMNKPPLQIGIGSYGTGSHAAFEDGGNINQLGYKTQEKSPIDSMKSLFVNMRDYNLYSTPDEALAKRSGYPYEKVGNEFHVEVPKSQEQIKNFGKPKYETLPGLPKSGNMQIEQFADGGELPTKSTITGKTKMRNFTVPNDSGFESAFVTVNQYPNKINDTSYSYMSGQPGMEQNMFYNTQIDPATGKPINTLNRNGMIGTIPQDSVNYYKNKISNLAGFKQGGKLSPTKARMMLHDGTVHGKPITDKQRRYFGAVASGYAADGGPMITDVQPSAHTYFRPMTRQGRQVPETPNFIAADGMTMQPVTDADRQAYNNYVLGMRKLPGYDAVNWQHDQTFQKNAAQQLGFDYSKAAAIQADMMARNEMYPGSIKGIQGSDPWGGKSGWVGDRERQKEYRKNEYLHYDKSGNLIGHIQPGFTPLTEQQFSSWADQNRVTAYQPDLPPTTNPMDPAYVAPTVPQAAPRATGLAATGFPTREEAIAKYKAKKAAGTTDDSPEMKYSIDTGAADYMAYGGPILGGFDARLNQNFPYPMTNQYPHKIGGQYHPYDHTRMEMGGHIPIGEQGLQVEGNQFRYLSPQTIELVGPKHTQGGIDIAYKGNKVNAEGGETFHVDQNGMMSDSNIAEDGTAGSGIVGGNLYVPGTNTKFKDAFKDVAKLEKKTSKLQDKASKFLNEYGSEGIGAKNRYQSPAFNYGVVMSDAYEQNKAKDKAIKNSLTEIQNKMLELGGMIDPENGAKKVSGMFKGKAKWGAKMMAKSGIKLDSNLLSKGLSAVEGTYDSLPWQKDKNGKPYLASSAVGKYQFLWNDHQQGIKKVTGIKDKESFRKSPEAQEKYFDWYVNNILPDQLERVRGYNKQGLTTEELVALLHFKGETGTKKWLESGVDETTKNNLSISEYLKRFNEGIGNYKKEESKQQQFAIPQPRTSNTFGLPGKESKYAGEYQGQKMQRGQAPSATPIQDIGNRMVDKASRDSVANWFEGDQVNLLPYKEAVQVQPVNTQVQNVDNSGLSLEEKVEKGKATVAEIKEYNKKYNAQADEDEGIDSENPQVEYQKTGDYDEFLDILGKNPNIDRIDVAATGPVQAYNPSMVNVPTMSDFVSPDVEPINLTGKEKGATKKGKGMRAKYKTNLGALREAFERPDPYQSMQIQPYLEPEYNVSFQNEKNAIQSAFAPAMKAARTAGERAAIAAQMAEQLANVDAKEFQFNQQNVGGIRGRNLQEMRGVRDTNLKLAMDAYEKTLGSKEAARQIRSAAQQKLYADKAGVDAENRKLAMYENYGGWYDKDGKWVRTLAPSQLKTVVPTNYDPTSREEDDDETVTTSTSVDPTTGAKTTTRQKSKKQTEYYGGPIAYFGQYMPVAPVRRYIAGGAVGGGMGMGMGHGAPGGMHGLPGQQGSMASRYSPGGDSSYYQKKKKKKKS